jgi:Domain of unknown function (DUF6946)
MRIYGLDFTSAPDSTASKSRKVKRLMLAVCTLKKQELTLEAFRPLNTNTKGDFTGFEKWLLETDEEWVAGIDFPFGQPTTLVTALNWPASWEGYVKYVEQLGKDRFERALIDYKASKPKGEKHLFRQIDKLTASQSPMTLDYTPVGKMFFQGAYRLCDSGASILPVRRITESNRIVVEAYPALVARKWIGLKQGYKNDDPTRADKYMAFARCDIVSAIRGREANSCRVSFKERYGFTVQMTDDDANRCVEDFTGDLLDSVLCAVQAAWAFRRKENNYGIPKDADRLEGWICDPETVQTGGGIGMTYYSGRPDAVQSISDAIPLYGDKEFESPTRSTIPMLSLLIHSPDTFHKITNQLGLNSDHDMFLEYPVRPPEGQGSPSQTDLMLKSNSGALAIEAKWTEPMYKTVESWLKSVNESNGKDVLNGWLSLLQKRVKKKLVPADFNDAIYQMVHRAASAAACGSDSRLAYFLFKPSPDRQAATFDDIKEKLCVLWDKLGKPETFPFYVVEIEMASLDAYESIRHLAKGQETTSALVTAALKGESPLFAFESFRVERIGEDS